MKEPDDRAPPADPAVSARRDAAAALLGAEATWCEGARELVALGDPLGLGPLVTAVRSRIEGSRTCLVDALVALDGGRRARDFARSPDRAHRQLALDLMVLLEADDQLPDLTRVATDDPDGDLRRAAVTALDQRTRSPAWRAAMIGLLDAGDPAVRGAVVDSLAADLRGELPAALRRRLAVEGDADVRARLEAALAGAPP